MVIELSRLFAICLVWFVVGFIARMAIEIISRHFRRCREPNVIEQCSEQFARLRDLQQQAYQMREYCGKCGTTQDCKLVHDPSGVGTYCCECNYLLDYDHDDDFDDDEDDWDMDEDDWEDDQYDDPWDDEYDEPVGSCENCNTNLYADDDPELCDQCLWMRENFAG